MKSLFFLSLIFLSCSGRIENNDPESTHEMGVCNSELIFDDSEGIAIYDSPKGSLVEIFSFDDDVPDFDFGKVLSVNKSEGDWFEIMDSLQLKSGLNLAGKWVEARYTRIYSNNYNGLEIHLRTKPSHEAETVFSITETSMFHVELCNNGWLFVSLEGKKGWLAAENQCANDVTNCN